MSAEGAAQRVSRLRRSSLKLRLYPGLTAGPMHSRPFGPQRLTHKLVLHRLMAAAQGRTTDSARP